MDRQIQRTDWRIENGVAVRIITINNSYITAEELFNMFVESYNNIVGTYKTVDESAFKRHRNKGEEQSDYVANMVSGRKETSTHSHYFQPIVINNNDGTKSQGVIRVANHSADIGVFAKENPQYDLCISIVVGDKGRINPDTEVINGRTIEIFEYVLIKGYENKERVLMEIADKITNAINDGWNKGEDIDKRFTRTYRTNKDNVIDESYIRKIVREEIENVLNKRS